MLPFGSLFTQLPLLVIGILYVLYLGLSAVNKEKHSLYESNRSDLQIIETGKTIDYFTLAATSFQSSADKPKPFFIAPSDFFVSNFLFLDKDFPISSFFDIHIFSRPPPES
jgi:hypothetical protein